MSDIKRYASESLVETTASTINDDLNTHKNNKSNPHGVTAEQAGARPDTWMPTYSDVGAAPSSHNHDDRYYTESEIDTKVSTLNTAISGKANSSHTHAISDITNLQSTLNTKITAVTSTDNAIVRFNSTGGAVQNSKAYIDDSGNLTLDGTTIRINGAMTAVSSPTVIPAFIDGQSKSGLGYVNTSNLTVGSANKINTNAGSATQPVYFEGGIPKATTYTLGKSVPSDAVFTDTKYTLPNATSSTLGGVKVGSNITVSSGTISLTKANVTAALGYTPPTTDTNTTYGVVSTSADGLAPKRDGSTTKFLRADGTWAVPPDTNTTYTLSSITGTLAVAKGGTGQTTLTPAVGTAAARAIYAGTSDMTAGSSSLTTGTIYFVYE